MATFKKANIILILCFLLTQCKLPADRIKESFEKVNDSLENSDFNLDNSITYKWVLIGAERQQNGLLTSRADTLYVTVVKTNALIDSLKKVLQSNDSIGTNLDEAASLIIHTKVEKELKEGFGNICYYSNAYLIDSSKKSTLDSLLYRMTEIQNDNNWAKKYFQNTPTIAVVTILSKFENDCTNACLIILNDIYQHLKNKKGTTDTMVDRDMAQ